MCLSGTLIQRHWYLCSLYYVDSGEGLLVMDLADERSVPCANSHCPSMCDIPVLVSVRGHAKSRGSVAFATSHTDDLCLMILKVVSLMLPIVRDIPSVLVQCHPVLQSVKLKSCSLVCWASWKSQKSWQMIFPQVHDKEDKQNCPKFSLFNCQYSINYFHF